MILSLLVIGSTLLTSLMMMPYALTLAHADTRVTLRMHMFLLVHSGAGRHSFRP